MKIFLDTGNIEEIKKAYQTGMIDGVTTNPTLIAKEGRDFLTILKEIVDIFKNHQEASISAEVTAMDYQTILDESRSLAKINKMITVKVPITADGIRAIKTLSAEKIKTNATLCFSANQALLAAKAGATYVSPFLGRLEDAGEPAMNILSDIRQIYNNYRFTTKILAASIRSTQHVLEAALRGADVATMPYKIFEQLFQHPLTDKGLEKFLADWKNYQTK